MTYQIERNDEEIDAVLNKAMEGIEGGSNYHGASYEDGIQNVLLWLFGDWDNPPFD